MENQILKNNFVVAHSNTEQKPLVTPKDADFKAQILTIMNENNIKKDYCIQRFAWPHLLLPPNSLVLINQQKSGRTWSYLPVICSRVSEQINCAIDFIGPMVLVIVDDYRRAQDMSLNCQMLLSKTQTHKTKVVTLACQSDRKHFAVHLDKSYCFLIITMTQLIPIFQRNDYGGFGKLINFNKLLYIVIDDYDLMYKRNSTQFDRFFIYLMDLYKTNVIMPQLVVTSKHWHPNMLHSIQNTVAPLVLFGDFLEAAVYAKVALIVKRVNFKDKWQNAHDFLKSRTCDGRTIIYCNSINFLYIVQMRLKEANYDFLVLSNYKNLSYEDKQKIKHWQNFPTRKILVRLDNCIELKTVQNANYLIHYEFPAIWGKFKNRFSSISLNLHNAIAARSEIESELDGTKTPKVLILLENDRENTNMLRHLDNFMSLHNMERPKDLTKWTKNYLRSNEEQSALMGRPFCSMLTTFGKCVGEFCKSRHLLTTNDTVPDHLKEGIPADGTIIMKLLKVYNPTHFAVHLLMHKQPNTMKYHELPIDSSNSRENCLDFLNLAMMSGINRKRHWPPKIYDICIIFKDSEYQRVRIVNVSDFPKDKKVVQPLVPVIVQAIDINTDILHTKAGELYICPEPYLSVPPKAINVRLLGFEPCNKENNYWLHSETKRVSDKIWSLSNSRDVLLKASIDFSLKHTIYVGNIIAMSKNDGNCLHLPNYLTASVVAKKNEATAKKLRSMFSDIGKKDNEN